MRALFILTAFVATTSVAHAECLPTAEAVWHAHPGAHATWRLRLPGHEGTKCWFARGSANLQAPRIQQVGASARGRAAEPRTDGPAESANSRAKASAAAGPNDSSARAESQDTSPPRRRAPSSILIWGAPMRIDPTWEELFEKRERSAE